MNSNRLLLTVILFLLCGCSTNATFDDAIDLEKINKSLLIVSNDKNYTSKNYAVTVERINFLRPKDGSKQKILITPGLNRIDISAKYDGKKIPTQNHLTIFKAVSSFEFGFELGKKYILSSRSVNEKFSYWIEDEETNKKISQIYEVQAQIIDDDPDEVVTVYPIKIHKK